MNNSTSYRYLKITQYLAIIWGRNTRSNRGQILDSISINRSKMKQTSLVSWFDSITLNKTKKRSEIIQEIQEFSTKQLVKSQKTNWTCFNSEKAFFIRDLIKLFWWLIYLIRKKLGTRTWIMFLSNEKSVLSQNLKKVKST